MIVALSAAERASQPNGRGGIDPVLHGRITELVVFGSGLIIHHRVAVETGRDELICARIGKQVARKLFNGKPIETHISVEGIDHPVAISPHRPRLIAFVTIRVGVAAQIQPVLSPMFPEGRRIQHAVHERFVGVRACVGQEPVDFLDRRWKSPKIQTQATDERFLRRFRSECESLSLQPCENEVVNGIAYLRTCADRGWLDLRRLDVSPVFFDLPGLDADIVRPACTLVNPGLDQG